MEHSNGGGGGGGKRPNLSSSGEDRLSALHDDILVLILLRLDTTAEAVRTSVLSRLWRRKWSLLPELRFPVAPGGHHIRDVLTAPEGSALRRISVVTEDDSPDSVAAWLPVAASRLSGELLYRNTVEEEEEEGGTIPLPCFGKATGINLDLGFLCVALPSSGAFARLAELCLERVRFQGPCELGDVVSTPRCPGLRMLIVRQARGVARFAVRSESLLIMDLSCLDGLQHLSIDASALKKLKVRKCFGHNQPIADISAPQLVSLGWIDAHDPSTVQLGNLGQLQRLSTYPFQVYGQHDNRRNRELLCLFQRCQVIQSLGFTLLYPQGIGNFQYLIDDIIILPRVTVLSVYVMNEGHSFGASLFHVLRLCTGIRRLSLLLGPQRGLKAQSECQPGCICDQPSNWKTEELLLNCLQDVEISGLKGADHEVAFLKRLLNWAAVLKKTRITFHYSISKSKAKELCETLSSFSRPETCLEFCMYQDGNRMSMYSLSPGDEGSKVCLMR